MEAKKSKTKKKIPKKTTKKPAILHYHPLKTDKIFDESVPVSHLELSELKIKKPTLKLSDNFELSPFLISFASEKTFKQEETVSTKLNFAVSEFELTPKPTVLAIERLARRELLPQFLENDLTSSPISTRPLTIDPLLPSFTDLRAALQNFQSQHHIPEPLPIPVAINELSIPIKNKPQEIFANFIFPEAEDNENDEAEIITWDEVIRSNTLNEQVPTIKTKTLVFSEFKKNFTRPVLWLTKQRWPEKLGPWQMSAGWHRALTTFVLLSFAFVLPLHAMETINDLRHAQNNLPTVGALAAAKLSKAVSLITTNTASAATSFEAAEKDFSAAQTEIDNLNAAATLLLSILPSTRSTYLSGAKLISAGQNLSEAGGKISQGLSAAQTTGLDLTGRLKIISQAFESALPQLQQAEKNLQNLDWQILTPEQQTEFSKVQTILPNLVASVEKTVRFSQTLTTLLGAEDKKRYLLLFQNNTEIRPTGGFLGSFAVLDVSRGKITNLEVPEGGSYDLQGSLKKNLVAPLPLQLISARWEFQDSNWFPDFPTSARQALKFYEDAGWPTVDGVVAVNASFVSTLLKLLGPVEMTAYGRVIDSENFLFETQKIVEFDYAAYTNPDSERQEAAPKAFIGDLAEQLLAKTESLEVTSILPILETVQNGLNQKDLQFYFPDETIQKVVRELDWSGEIKQADGDYLMIVNTNLGGGKTDLVIEEANHLEVKIQSDGRIINTLTIKRTHHGLNGAMFTGVNNVNFLRVYVPKGSRLLSAEGFSIPDNSLFEKPEAEWSRDSEILFNEENMNIDLESGTMISEEAGKTTFGNWTQTRPGETTTITFVYELPFKLSPSDNLLQIAKDKIGLEENLAYSLLIQKQSGILDRQTSVAVTAENLKTVWSSDSNDKKIFDNQTDAFVSFIFE